MTTVIEKKYFERKHIDRYGQDSIDQYGGTLNDLGFRNCVFDHCSVNSGRYPKGRITISNVALINCAVVSAQPIGCAIEDCLVDTLTIRQGARPLFVRGLVFRHTVLKGLFTGCLIISDDSSGSTQEPELDQQWTQANIDYYRDVDWALDIREGEFEELELRGVPGHLVLRDPETQVLVTRERAKDFSWDRPIKFGVGGLAVKDMLESWMDSVVIVAPKANKDFRERLGEIELLRKEGIAEPD